MEHSRDHRVKADLQAVQQEAMQARRACSAVQQAKHLQELFLKRYNSIKTHQIRQLQTGNIHDIGYHKLEYIPIFCMYNSGFTLRA